MKPSLLVVFGLPGAGKSFVADILAKHFDYHIHNGDDDIPSHMKDTLIEKGNITDDMRRAFAANMIATTETLFKSHPRLVIHQTFLKEFMREAFLKHFPQATFILVQSQETLREKRYMRREYFNLGLAYLRHMSGLFEPPHIPHTILTNDGEGLEHIQTQLTTLLLD
jgi:gluconate kinase